MLKYIFQATFRGCRYILLLAKSGSGKTAPKGVRMRPFAAVLLGAPLFGALSAQNQSPQEP